MTDIAPLIEAVRARTAVLFAGAGLSANLGLPTWGELINDMANELGYDADVFGKHGRFTELAEYYVIKKGSLGAFRSKMDTKWHADHSRVDTSEHHRLILELNFPIVYTTNYDRWLEIAYERAKRKYTKIASLQDFPEIRDGVTQIVKFHGDFYDDQSIVLTERDYFDRLAFETPLDIKLRADSLGRTFLFIGYGIDDINIRRVLYLLDKMWKASKVRGARPQSYIFLSKPNHIQETILEHRGIHSIVSDVEDPGEGLLNFLKQLKAGL